MAWRPSATVASFWTAMVRSRLRMAFSQSAWKAGSCSSRSTGPKPCMPPRSWMPSMPPFLVASTDGTVEGEEEIVDRQGFDIAEAGLQRVPSKGVRTHDGARAGRRLLDQTGRQAVQYAEAVHEPLGIVIAGGERLADTLVHNDHRAALTGQGAHRPEHRNRVGHVVDALKCHH